MHRVISFLDDLVDHRPFLLFFVREGDTGSCASIDAAKVTVTLLQAATTNGTAPILRYFLPTKPPPLPTADFEICGVPFEPRCWLATSHCMPSQATYRRTEHTAAVDICCQRQSGDR